MKKILLAAVVAVSLAACSAPEPTRPHVPIMEDVTILSVKRPKHFKLLYRINRTGQTVEVRSKHCSAWDRVTVGHTYHADVSISGCDFIRSIR